MKQDITEGFPLNNYYSKIYKRYDLVNRLFTFGLDQNWRRKTAKLCIVKEPAQVLDICCGTGDLTLQLWAQSKGRIPITGYDFNRQMLDSAIAKSNSKRAQSITFIQGDAANLPFANGAFEAITIGFGFRNLTFNNPNSEKHLKEMIRVLTIGGRLYILESGIPENPFIRFFYNFYLKWILTPLGGLISGDWKAYKYLAGSSANFFNIDQVQEMLQNHGFRAIQRKTWFFGATQLIVAEKE
jgi:demethylmenaquinone methyltransferase/2-methoxy-6-polyprenyl-1,4-benzoquinol methylase